MGDNSLIEWTEATWNPIIGCTVVSEGCRNCYAMTLAGGRMKNHQTREGLTRLNAARKPVWTGEVRLITQAIEQPLRWNRPRMIFVGAHTDIFHEEVPDEWLDELLMVMLECPQHTFQILTKRPKRMRDYVNSKPFEVRKVMRNIWLGVSAEDQATADERIPYLLDTAAHVRWLSAEPLLGLIDLTSGNPGGAQSANYLTGMYRGPPWLGSGLDWVVVGGESGPASRPMHLDWARLLRDQCAAAGVPFFFKQWGDWLPHGVIDAAGMTRSNPRGNDPDQWHEWAADDAALDGYSIRIGKREAGRYLDGVTHGAMPGARR